MAQPSVNKKLSYRWQTIAMAGALSRRVCGIQMLQRKLQAPDENACFQRTSAVSARVMTMRCINLHFTYLLTYSTQPS